MPEPDAAARGAAATRDAASPQAGKPLRSALG
jgi:hypothetical protein